MTSMLMRKCKSRCQRGQQAPSHSQSSFGMAQNASALPPPINEKQHRQHTAQHSISSTLSEVGRVVGAHQHRIEHRKDGGQRPQKSKPIQCRGNTDQKSSAKSPSEGPQSKTSKPTMITPPSKISLQSIFSLVYERLQDAYKHRGGGQCSQRNRNIARLDRAEKSNPVRCGRTTHQSAT